MTTETRQFVRSSVRCSKCGYVIKPDGLRDAVRTEVEGDDGKWGIQYDHAGTCPATLARRANGADR